MVKIVVFGNSGSGKTTLALELASEYACAHLDLDSVAWVDDRSPPTRKPLLESESEIRRWLSDTPNWIVEGCYADLLALVLPHSTEIIFLNPGVETCIANCRNRCWEPHKYISPQEQAANLEMLIAWVQQYESREDEFSLQAHRSLFDAYARTKREYKSNERGRQ